MWLTDDLDGGICVGCGREWRRDEDVSPGEVEDLCRGCFELESDEGDAA